MSELKYCDKLFHKYRPVNEHTESLLINNELFFNNTDNSNDPFDCKVDFFHRGAHEMWVEFFCQRNMHPAAARNLIKARLKEGVFKKKKDGILYEGKDLNNDENFLRACCFSEEKDGLLMWGHYARNHEGICLSFKSFSHGKYYLLPLDSDYTLPFCRVEYSDNKPNAINLLGIRNPNETKRIIKDFYLTKFTDWQYENEYRLLETKYVLGGKSTINFQKDALEGVTLGLNIKSEDAQRIKDIIDQHYKGIGVKLYRTFKIDGKYAIDFKEITDFDKYIKLLGKK